MNDQPKKTPEIITTLTNPDVYTNVPDYFLQERARFSKIIQAQSDDLMHLINDLLDLSRIESGNINIAKGRVSLYALLEEVGTVTREKLAHEIRNLLTG